MAEYTIRVRRYQPEADGTDGATGPYWQEFEVELEESLSVLDALLDARSNQDGSLAVRCSCRAAICGSCGVKINGRSTLACKTKIQDAQVQADRAAGTIYGDPVAPPEAHPGADRRTPEAEPRRCGPLFWSSPWGTCP